MCSTPSCFRARPNCVRTVFDTLPPASGVVGANGCPGPYTASRTGQRRHHLAYALKARRRALLIDQKHRVDLARCIFHSHNEILPRRHPLASQACVEASWCSNLPTIGRRGRFLRCAERCVAFCTRPVRCRCTLVTV